jgi:hypothetical protein
MLPPKRIWNAPPPQINAGRTTWWGAADQSCPSLVLADAVDKTGCPIGIAGSEELAAEGFGKLGCDAGN